MSGFLKVKNWEKWQYRGDRNLPWIKLYRDLLLDHDFVQLSDVERGHLMCIWLAASANNGRIPDDAKAVQRLINSEIRPDLEKFLSLELLEKVGKRRRRKDAPNREDKRREEKSAAPELPEWMPTQAWEAWEKYRRERGKTLTPSTTEKQICLLAKLREEGSPPEAVIEQSITQGWQGLFALKSKPEAQEAWQ